MTAEPIERIAMDALATLVVEAGELAREFFATLGSLKVRRKADSSLVSDADHAVSRHIVEGLQRLYPGDAIVDEEAGRLGPDTADVCWYVDPIDGTSNFLGGHTEWCVMVGAIDQRDPSAPQPLVGLIHEPMIDRLTIADCRETPPRASLNGDAIRVCPVGEPSYDSVVCYPSNAHRKLRATAPGKIRAYGSGGVHLAHVAAGRALASVHTKYGPWDLVAGAVLVAAAGGAVFDFSGAPLPIGNVANFLGGVVFGPPDLGPHVPAIAAPAPTP